MIEREYRGRPIIIYEYEEAEDIIAELAKANYGDQTPVARGGFRRNVCNYYNYPCSFDIETTTIKPGQLNYPAEKYSPPIAFPYLFQWNIFGTVLICRTYTQALQIFEWIKEYFELARNRRMIFFVHNLSYEAHFFRELWDIQKEQSFCLDDHHPITIYTKDGFLFRDSYKMSNMSLETLTKDYSKFYFKEKDLADYSELRTPYSDIDDNMLLYSVLDVLSLSDAIEGFLEAQNEPLWTRCPTSTSFIRAKLKKRVGIGVKKRSDEQVRYWRIVEKQKLDKNMYELQKRLGRGGNTHSNRKYTGRLLHNLLHIDIKSSYPAQEVCRPEFPLGFWQPLDPGMEIDDILLFEKNGLCTMFDLVLIEPEIKERVPVPYISISKMLIIEGSGMRASDNGRYLGGLKAIQISIYGIELPIILRQYNFKDAFILNGYFTEKGYLPDIFRSFVLDLYGKKTTLKGIKGKEIEYAIAKTHVNGVFGMCYTDPLRYTFELQESGEIDILEPPEISAFLEKYQSSISYFLPYAWGTMTAALGRLQLQDLIDAAGWENFVYCDTDSIFAIDTPEARAQLEKVRSKTVEEYKKCGFEIAYKDTKNNEHILGDIAEEDRCEYFKSYGAKKYITVENGELKCTIAGVPKKAGAKIIGTPENFQLGLNFEGAKTGKNCLWYNPRYEGRLEDPEGRPIEIYHNIAMLPCDYLLSMSAEYEECLSIEGNFHWLFKEGDKNIINEEDL